MTSPAENLKMLVTGTGIILVGSMTGRLLSLFGQVLIVRELSPEAFGHIALAYTIALAAASIGLIGIPEGVVRFVSAHDADATQRDVLRGGFLLALLGGVAAASTVFLFRPELSSIMNDEQLPGLLVLFVPYLLIYPIAKTAIATLRSQKQSVRATFSRDLIPYVGAIVLFVVLAAEGVPEVGAVLYWVSVPFFMTIFGLYYVNQRFSIRSLVSTIPEQTTVRRLWSFSWPLAIGTSFTMLFANLDVLMIGYFLESSAVGQYRAVQPLRQVTGFILTAFVFLYYPIATEYFSDDEIGDLDDLYSTSTKWIVGATIPPVLVLAFFAPDVIRVLFGSAYLPAAPALTVLVLGMSVRALVGPSGTTIKAINRPRVELFASFVGVVINLVLNVVLIPVYGIVGAAFATAAGYATFNVIETAFIYNALRIHPFRVNTFKPLVPTVGVAASLAFATRGQQLGFVALAVIGVVIGLAYLGSLVVTNSLDDEDLFMLDQFQNRTGIDMTRIEDRLK